MPVSHAIGVSASFNLKTNHLLSFCVILGQKVCLILDEALFGVLRLRRNRMAVPL